MMKMSVGESKDKVIRWWEWLMMLIDWWIKCSVEKKDNDVCCDEEVVRERDEGNEEMNMVKVTGILIMTITIIVDQSLFAPQLVKLIIITIVISEKRKEGKEKKMEKRWQVHYYHDYHDGNHNNINIRLTHNMINMKHSFLSSINNDRHSIWNQHPIASLSKDQIFIQFYHLQVQHVEEIQIQSRISTFFSSNFF